MDSVTNSLCVLNGFQRSRRNWSECLLWTNSELLPGMSLAWCICCMSGKLRLQCKSHPIHPELCHLMKISRDPYHLIVNAVLLLLPPLILCSGSEPMDSVNCFISENVSRCPGQVNTHSPPSSFHPAFPRFQSSRSMGVVYYIVQLLLLQ